MKSDVKSLEEGMVLQETFSWNERYGCIIGTVNTKTGDEGGICSLKGPVGLINCIVKSISDQQDMATLIKLSPFIPLPLDY